jgi:hypothetical protein
MSRKIITYSVSDEKSRDFGKSFELTEMSAYQCERWCLKAIRGIIKAGFNVPDEFQDFPAQALIAMGISSFLAIDEFTQSELMIQMLDTVKIKSSKDSTFSPRPLLSNGDDIDEVSTLVNLRKEFFKLNLNFLGVVGSQIIQELQEVQ